ncbi:MAG: hypothetical protein ACI8RZ_001944 [Myxococcota bacterium]|jgi:hypothetical protein
MSNRNTGLFLPGHIDPAEIARVFAELRSMEPGVWSGAEAPRVGHGTHAGHDYTLVALRFFEIAGLPVLNLDAVPGTESVDVELGEVLSRIAGSAVYLFYDEENAAGGAARFESGELVDRECWDGRKLVPMHRHMHGAEAVEDLDPSDFIWKPASAAMARMSMPLLGPGVITDDEIETLIEGAGAEPVVVVSGVEDTPPAPASKTRPSGRREKLRGLLRRFKGR